MEINTSQTDSSEPARRRRFPASVEAPGFELSFDDGGGEDIAFQVEFRDPRNFINGIPRYPALVEFRAMLEEWGELKAWNGRYFHAA